MKRKSREPEDRTPRREAFALTSLDQIKVLASPLRVRILGALCRERTTKQVAELLGENPTRLYHHVGALEKAGLVELSSTRRNRGTLEKYYLAVARTIQTDGRLFQATGSRRGGTQGAALRRMFATFFETTSSELNRLVDHESDSKTLEEEGVVSFLEVRGTKKEVDDLREKLLALVRSLTADTESTSARNRRYRLTLAYFPLDVETPPES